MSDLDTLLNARSPIGRPCEFGKWLALQTPEDQASIRRAVAEGPASTAHIFRVLRERGCPSSSSTLQKHRSGTCSTCSTTS